jgi:hypothetical protein
MQSAFIRRVSLLGFTPQFINAPIAIMNRIRLSENPTLSLSYNQFAAFAGLRWGEITALPGIGDEVANTAACVRGSERSTA